MKVICVKNYSNSRTTIGKVYEIYQPFDNHPIKSKIRYYFVADNGNKLWYDPDYFITLEQHRENQLNKIGISQNEDKYEN